MLKKNEQAREIRKSINSNNALNKNSEKRGSNKFLKIFMKLFFSINPDG